MIGERYYITRQKSILDNLTGVEYPLNDFTDLIRLCELLNEVNNRADRNAVLYYNLKENINE